MPGGPIIIPTDRQFISDFICSFNKGWSGYSCNSGYGLLLMDFDEEIIDNEAN